MSETTGTLIMAAKGADAPRFEFTADQTNKLLELLGLSPDDPSIDVATILTVIEDMSKASAGDPIAAAKKAGLTTIDPESLTHLQAEAQKGRDLIAASARREVEDKVDTAIKAGKIPPARKGHWITLVTNDGALGEVLASMPANVLPVAEIGHSGGAEDAAEPAEWFR
ncbi:hypothetical protein DFJ75_1698 [Williamsia muralis]|uniref:Mu-like prophage I protein n=1 Tax=Williamsia marianensis TaxID=85044 RepID=A0A495K0W5_WILMA|nr:hypothetical protein [Williamsia muralis]RKR94893.1 hypothetical protein DFJ75_1698 [Williamsia muralis]